MSAIWTVVGLGLGWVGFAYLGYPLILLLLSRWSPRELARGDVFPPLSVIIAVHNGGRELGPKLERTLALEYPGKVEVIVSSDGSTDDTVAVAERFRDRAVSVVTSEYQRGKEAAQAAAIARASGDVLVFTDVSAELSPDALRQIVRPFADAGVGAVSSEDDVDAEEGEGAYVRFEMALRRLESDATTLVGLSGSFFAVRRSLSDPWPTDLASDFRMALEAARRGLRAVSEPAARARYRVVTDPGAEWSRKVRTVRRGLAVLSAYRELLHPAHGRAAFSLWGHKVARFTSPFALITVLLASFAGAASSPLAAGLLTAQLAGYGVGLLALMLPSWARFRAPRLTAYFLIVNASMLAAWAYHLSGQRAVYWKPTLR